jgi:hypothetical protein
MTISIHKHDLYYIVVYYYCSQKGQSVAVHITALVKQDNATLYISVLIQCILCSTAHGLTIRHERKTVY